MASASVVYIKISVEAYCGNPSLLRELCTKMASTPTSLAAACSDSGVKRATVEIVYDVHEIAAPPIEST